MSDKKNFGTKSDTQEEKWICAICGRKNLEKICVQCGNPRGASPIVIENNTQPASPPIPAENEQLGNGEHNRKGGSKDNIPLPPKPQNGNDFSKTDTKMKIFLGIIGLVLAFLVFLGVNTFWNWYLDNDPLSSQMVVNQKKDTGYHEKKSDDYPPVPNNIQIEKPSKEDGISADNKADSKSTRNTSDERKFTDEPKEIISATNENQRNAIRALYGFHSNITKHKLKDAYEFFSPEMKKRISYDGWAPGFNTTVSSTPSDVKIASESNERVVLTYYLTAVDNPGGTQVFTGTAVLVKTNSGWKLDEITNKLKQY